MSWNTLLGHEKQIHRFRHLAAQRRLAHAYLFVGPSGIGKHRFAQELAKALLCEAVEDNLAHLQACNHCDACKLVAAGTHPDLFTVRRPEEKNEFPISVIQQFLQDFSLKSARRKGKIGIIDDADDFNEDSANCFLKTLEEPSAGSLFILLSHSSDRQLATIKSRCQLVRFAPLTDLQVQHILELHGIEEKSLQERLLRQAGGRPGQALALAEESLWQCHSTLMKNLAQPNMARGDSARQWIEFVEEAGKDSAKQRRRASLVLHLLIDSFNEVMRLQNGLPPRSANPDDQSSLALLAKRARPETILALLERSLETELHVSRYIQLSLVLEGLIDQLGQLLDQAGPLPLRYQGFAG